MINMNYCRFNNTELALDECLDTIKSGKELSEEEMNSCRKLFGQFIDFCYDSGILEDDYDETNERLEEFFGTIGKPEYW